jgi:hypothetical protein
MPGSEHRIRWPDGASLSVPFPYGRIGGTYYWNPGSPTAPHVTLTRSLGMPGAGVHTVFLRKGMTSDDTLGPGISGNVSTILPSVGLNGTVPNDGSYIPRPWKSRVTTVEAGIGTPNASPAITATYTPQQIADFISRYVTPPAMGPQDELPPFVRTLGSGLGAVGPVTAPPIRYLSSRYQNPLGNEMGDWRASAEPVDTSRPASPVSTPQEPGGLLGLIQDYLRNI